jgi:pimeloyl-ACP methyl ester carboxylesterase
MNRVALRGLIIPPCLALCFPRLSATRPGISSLHHRRELAMRADSAPARRVAYLHGFASSSKSAKGLALRKKLGDHMVSLPDLNRPSFEDITITGALIAMDELHEEMGRPRWNLVGSSMGGHVAALWTALHPDDVNKLVLLCPAFDLAALWPSIIGQGNFEKWQSEGRLPFKDGAGEWKNVHYGFVEDAKEKHPAWPVIPVRIPSRASVVVPMPTNRARRTERERERERER